VAWASPTLTELQAKLRRDLRDNNGEVFSAEQLMDFANEGIIELSRVKPNEVRGEITEAPFTLDPPPVDIWALALTVSDGRSEWLSPMDENVSTDGWLYYGRQLIFGPHLATRLGQLLVPDQPGPYLYSLRWFGYIGREVFDGTPNEVADFRDPEDEICVRRYARWAGFRALDSDRGLYQQWQTQANNSDVSPTQLNQMTSLAESEWDQLRRKVVTFRHAPLGTR